MPLKWKVFRIASYINLVLSLSNLGEYLYFIGHFHPDVQAFQKIVFIVSFSLFANASIVFLWILGKKYPDRNISQLTEGLVYFFSVFAFIACFLLLLFSTRIAIEIFRKTIFLKGLTTYGKFLVAFVVISIFLAGLNIFSGIRSFQLLKTIRKNREIVLEQISSLGSEPSEMR
jgi:hypothetical protein